MPSSYAEIYKWVDEQGRTHYGDKSVENSEQLNITTKKSGNSNSSSDRAERRQRLIDTIDEDNARKKETKDKKRKEKKKRERNCAIAKDKLTRMERAGYLYDLDKDGNRVIISNEERKKETSGLRKNIKKYCK